MLLASAGSAFLLVFTTAPNILALSAILGVLLASSRFYSFLIAALAASPAAFLTPDLMQTFYGLGAERFIYALAIPAVVGISWAVFYCSDQLLKPALFVLAVVVHLLPGLGSVVAFDPMIQAAGALFPGQDLIAFALLAAACLVIYFASIPGLIGVVAASGLIWSFNPLSPAPAQGQTTYLGYSHGLQESDSKGFYNSIVSIKEIASKSPGTSSLLLFGESVGGIYKEPSISFVWSEMNTQLSAARKVALVGFISPEDSAYGEIRAIGANNEVVYRQRYPLPHSYETLRIYNADPATLEINGKAVGLSICYEALVAGPNFQAFMQNKGQLDGYLNSASLWFSESPAVNTAHFNFAKSWAWIAGAHPAQGVNYSQGLRP